MGAIKIISESLGIFSSSASNVLYSPKRIVKLLVKQKVAKYFILKKYLPTQKIIQKLDNEDLEVQYSITDFKEIEELLIKWLPHVKVLEPLALNEMVREVLLGKLEGTDF